MYKKLASIITVFILLVALLVPLATVKAQVIQSITLSASYLNDKSVLEIIVYAPGYEEDYIELGVKEAKTGAPVTVNSSETTFKALNMQRAIM